MCIRDRASGLSPERLAQIVADNTEEKLLGVFGEETVNVLGVNLDLSLIHISLQSIWLCGAKSGLKIAGTLYFPQGSSSYKAKSAGIPAVFRGFGTQ